MSKRAQGTFWIVLIVLLGLTRIHAAAKYFSIDNVNLAFALEEFDPSSHRPQPPGYPFFVGFARLVNILIDDAAATFLVLSVVVTGLCLPVIVALGKRLFTETAGQTAALLLLLNPVFWQSGLDGPLRVNLTLFSLLVAYCSWRAWNGERSHVYWSACALGIGSGFRPDLLAYLFPLWIVSAIVGTRSLKVVLSAAGVFAAIVLTWIGALVYAVGGPAQVYTLATTYLADPSTQFIPLNAVEQGWTRQFSRLVTWNGMAIFGWIWTIPVIALMRTTATAATRSLLRSPQMIFIAVWVIPGLLFQAFFHVAAPGHTLFSVPAFCVLGSYLIWTAADRLSHSDPARIAELSVAATLVVNVLLFLNFYPLPSAPAAPSLVQSVKNSIAYAIFETSISTVRDPDNLTRETLKELHEIAPTNAPWLIVTTDAYEKDWFMNWRIMRYYAPAADIWVMAEQRRPKLAVHARRDKASETTFEDVYEVEVPQGGRIIWLLEPGGPVHRELEKLQPVKGGRHVLYTDVPADAPPFQVFSFRFVPVSAFQ